MFKILVREEEGRREREEEVKGESPLLCYSMVLHILVAL